MNYYEYDNVMVILDTFIEALKNNAIIYEGDLILYYNEYGVPSMYFQTLSIKVQQGDYSYQEKCDIAEKMNLMLMALNSNLIDCGRNAKNPAWAIYFSKVKFGYVEGNSDTNDVFLIPEDNTRSYDEIMADAESAEAKIINTKN